MLGRNYFNSLAPDVELARVYGDGMDGVNGVRVYEDMVEEMRIKMHDLLRMGLSPKEIQKARTAIKEARMAGGDQVRYVVLPTLGDADGPGAGKDF